MCNLCVGLCAYNAQFKIHWTDIQAAAVDGD